MSSVEIPWKVFYICSDWGNSPATCSHRKAPWKCIYIFTFYLIFPHTFFISKIFKVNLRNFFVFIYLFIYFNREMQKWIWSNMFYFTFFLRFLNIYLYLNKVDNSAKISAEASMYEASNGISANMWRTFYMRKAFSGFCDYLGILFRSLFFICCSILLEKKYWRNANTNSILFGSVELRRYKCHYLTKNWSFIAIFAIFVTKENDDLNGLFIKIVYFIKTRMKLN